MSILATIGLIIAAFLSSTVSGFVGMAGGILLLGAMSLVLPYQALIPLHGMVQLFSNSYRAFLLRRNIVLKPFIIFTLGAPIGGFMGYLVLSSVKNPEYFLFLVIGLLVYVIFKPKKLPDIKLNTPGFFILGVVAGTLGCLIGATGPFLAPFFIRKDFSKENIVATKAAFQIIIHLVKIPTFLALSFNYFEHSWLLLFMFVGVICGTRLGTFILSRINGKQFMIYVKIAMGVMALRLIYKLAITLNS